MSKEEIEAIRELSAAINRLVDALPPRSGFGGGWPPITVQCQCNHRPNHPYGYPSGSYG